MKISFYVRLLYNNGEACQAHFDAAWLQWQSVTMMMRFLFVLMVWAAPVQAASKLQVVTLDGRTHVFFVQLADTPQLQARGLMFVERMAPRSGMLFPIKPPRQVRFWMRNTLIPLDMVFILPGGTIGQIVTRHDTQSDAHTLSLAPVSGVLELNAGEAAKLKIGVGDRVLMNGMAF